VTHEVTRTLHHHGAPTTLAQHIVSYMAMEQLHVPQMEAANIEINQNICMALTTFLYTFISGI
jgi:hypothetical protein